MSVHSTIQSPTPTMAYVPKSLRDSMRAFEMNEMPRDFHQHFRRREAHFDSALIPARGPGLP